MGLAEDTKLSPIYLFNHASIVLFFLCVCVCVMHSLFIYCLCPVAVSAFLIL